MTGIAYTSTDAAALWSAEVVKGPNGEKFVVSEKPRPNSALEDAAAELSMLLWFGAVCTLPLLFLFIVYTAVAWASKTAITVLLGGVCFCFLPPGNLWQAYRRFELWWIWRRYFGCRLVTPPKPFLDPTKHYVFGEFPHAVYPLGSWLGLPLCGLPGTGLPENLRGGIATVMFQLPVVRHNYAWAGCMPADLKLMLQQLRTPGGCVSVMPEGIAGIFLTGDPAKESIFLSKRKGFVRMAIQAGADLVPVYHAGVSQLLTFWGNERLSRRCRVTIGVFWGKWGLPLPRKHSIVTFVGKPIPVAQCNKPSDEEVDRVHALFTREIMALFDAHKHLLPGWEAKKLHVV
ncbi:hypothetical protein WJX81_007967 [Elliptochloris bilobata]|uniref:Acyltransferase n=1 Tax=Elliptochloris bilobata TaxID=381761 RepID=A0AAW1RGV2_9CHLO